MPSRAAFSPRVDRSHSRTIASTIMLKSLGDIAPPCTTPRLALKAVPPMSPRLFNIMVDAIVREWLRSTLGEKAALEGIGQSLATLMAAFYADDGIIQSRCPHRLQYAVNKLVALFERVGLRTNTSKTKAMTCIPGKIRVPLCRDVYDNQRQGLASVSTWRKR